MALSLDGIRVVDLTQGIAGPMCSRLLADYGAEVIKIEPRGRGDWVRGARAGTMAGMSSQPCAYNYAFENLNRNKRSITIDLAQESGREIIHKLVKRGDIFVTNMLPRQREKYGLEYEPLSEINPRLIYACLTGYGEKGPDRNEPGYDSTAFWARSGIWDTLAAGQMPPYQTNGMGDSLSGLWLAYGIMMALVERAKSGIGQKVESSLFHAGVWAMTWEISGALATGLNPKYMPRNEMPNAGGNCYQTKDGRWFRITFGPTKNYWSTFCQVIEREDLENDPRFDSMEAILNNRDALFKLLDQEVFPTKTLAEWKERFAGSGIPYSPLQTITEVTADQDAIDNEFFLPCEHPVHGRVMHVTNPPNLSRTPQEIKEPAPELDQHQEEVLLGIGYNREEIKALKQRGAID